MEELGWTGWYYRTLQEGQVEAGQHFNLMDRPHPEWTIRRTAAVRRGRDSDEIQTLAEIPELAGRFRANLKHRLARLV